MKGRRQGNIHVTPLITRNSFKVSSEYTISNIINYHITLISMRIVY